jgi:hypothetical protein
LLSGSIRTKGASQFVEMSSCANLIICIASAEAIQNKRRSRNCRPESWNRRWRLPRFEKKLFHSTRISQNWGRYGALVRTPPVIYQDVALFRGEIWETTITQLVKMLHHDLLLLRAQGTVVLS